MMIKNFEEVKNFIDLINFSREHFNDKTALIWRPKFRTHRFTFNDFYLLAQKVASFLENKGLRKGDRLILWTYNSPYWAAIFLGCQLKGVIPVPLSVQNTPRFVQKIKDFVDAKLIFYSEHLAGGKIKNIHKITVENFFEIQKHSTFYTPAELKEDDIAEILFTSGTTGEPKGVILTQNNIISNIKAVRGLEILKPDDRMISFLPLSHIFEQVAGFFVPFSMGVTLTQAAVISGLHLQKNMQEDHPTKMTAVPEFLKLAINRIEQKAEEEGKGQLLKLIYNIAPFIPVEFRRFLAKPILERFGGKLHSIVAGGAALDPETGKKWEAFGVIILQGYGATETSPVISVNRYENHKLDSVGPLIPGIKVKIAADGEILVKGPNVALGYYKNTEKTKAAFRGGWYYTDDIGYFDQNGHLHIKGRKKYLIVTPAGENVYPEDLEFILNQNKSIADSTVLGLTRKDGGFEIHTVILPKFGIKISDPWEVISQVNKKLEPHQRIQAVSIWGQEDFPRTPTKKIKKEEVLSWLREKEKGQKEEIKIAETGKLETIIAKITDKKAEKILPDSKIVQDLKMDSLQRITLVSLIEEELNVILDEGEITSGTTVAEIKEKIIERKQKEERYEFNRKAIEPWFNFWRLVLWKIFSAPLINFFAKIEVKGSENLKNLSLPVIFYNNHISPVDAVILLRALPEKIRQRTAIAAATDQIWENPYFRKYVGVLTLLFNIYPFSRREQIKSSLEYTGRLLDKAYSIIIFPEGQISPNGKLQPLKAGAGLIAVEMETSIIPVLLKNTNRIVPSNINKITWPKRDKVEVTFGQPLTFTPATSHLETTAVLQKTFETMIKNN